ncbi:alpha/beta fold hydrolase [Bordetella sp. N]|uniref:alpha/beta fold hydrolase n=1 Tax=Bordetella sp. N TaxID=1746199 RepID=UPI000A6CCADB|nr:alpha/beta hydrolase [Bordetella sp. N]
MFRRFIVFFAVFVTAIASGSARAETSDVSTRYMDVDGIRIFYREAGVVTAPTILLLHGFPSSSHMFRTLIPKLSERFHVIAPDYPGMGFSDAPPESRFPATFDGVASVMERFVEQMKIRHAVLYEQDFGGPVGMRLALHHPERVDGLAIQNTPISLDGWNPERLNAILANQKLPPEQRRRETEKRVAPATVEFLYHQGTRHPEALDPASWAVDEWVMRDAERVRVMTSLQLDIPSNFSQYPVWQAYLAKYQPKTLVVWGVGDPIFTRAGADAVKRFVPAADVRYYPTGHFALEEDAEDIAGQIVRTFATNTRNPDGND